MKGVSPVPVQMWEGRAPAKCRRGRSEPSPGADVGRVSIGPGADVGGVSPFPAQLPTASGAAARTASLICRLDALVSETGFLASGPCSTTALAGFSPSIGLSST